MEKNAHDISNHLASYLHGSVAKTEAPYHFGDATIKEAYEVCFTVHYSHIRIVVAENSRCVKILMGIGGHLLRLIREALKETPYYLSFQFVNQSVPAGYQVGFLKNRPPRKKPIRKFRVKVFEICDLGVTNLPPSPPPSVPPE